MKQNIFLLLAKPYTEYVTKLLEDFKLQVFIISNEELSQLKRLQAFFYKEDSFSKNSFPCKLSTEDIIINCGFKKDFFHKEAPNCHIFHAHPSLLPLYRGYFAISSQLMLGVRYSGLTIYKENGKIDAGNIIYQKKFKLEPYYYAADFIEIFSKEVAIFINGLIYKNISLIDIMQDERNATYNQHNRNKNLIIDFNMSAISVYNMVRAYSPPFSSAYINIKGKKCKILSCDIETWTGLDEEVGNIVRSDINGTVIACGDGSINIKKIEYENEIMSGEFLERLIFSN